MPESHQGRTGVSFCWATSLNAEVSTGSWSIVETKAARTAITISCVTREMMFETRSTSSWPTASTRRVIRPAPIQVGMPIAPKEMKYWITSWPVAKPAPTTSPTKA